MPRVSKAAKDKKPPRAVKARGAGGTISGACLCGAVTIEVDVPVFWAWHDHSAASRKAHGSAYATYVGTYRSKCRIVEGETLDLALQGGGKRECAEFLQPVRQPSLV